MDYGRAMTEPHLPDPMIKIGDDGTPRSGVSGDVYYSTAGGAAETRHVFLNGIGAPEIWRTRTHFRVGELGFGTGLNFLVTWHDWKETAPENASLDYVAVEGYPIDVDALRTILSGIPGFAAEANALLEQWPCRVGGVHRLHFDGGRVRLTLLYGEALEMLRCQSGDVDAWFLDGFAPSVNPAMWSSEVLTEVARLSAGGARLATFSAAGAVRRGLADVGFHVKKREGYGHKRDCVAALFNGDPNDPEVQGIAVVGAGIAGGALARALSQRGHQVTLIDAAAKPGCGASGNPAALLAPRLPRERTVLGRIMAASYLYAVRFYDALETEVDGGIWLGVRGGLALARNEDEAERQVRAVAAFGWPEDVMRLVDGDTASALAGIEVDKGGLWFTGAGTLCPPAITRHLAESAAYCRAEIASAKRVLHGWQLGDVRGEVIGEFDAVVLAAGVGVMDLMGDKDWPLRANRGQLAYMPELSPSPKVPVTYGGYLTPSIPLPDGRAGHVLGATYARRDEVPDTDWDAVRAEDTSSMLALADEHLPCIIPTDPIGGRTALRATIRNYVPLAGMVEDGLFVLGGLGSRGFLTAPLLAELIADQISNAPLPLEGDLVAALDPRRYS